MFAAVRKGTLALGLALAAAAAHALPLLNEPAVMSPKALHSAMLAVGRAGDRLVAVGERGTVLLSDDHGVQWRQVPVPVRVSLTAVRFLDARQGWAAGHQGVILHTEDGGEHWTVQLDGVRAAKLIEEVARHGDERARRVAQRFVDEGPDKPFFDLDFADGRHGMAVGAYNLAFATADGGATWAPVDLDGVNPKARHLYAVRMGKEPGQVFVAGEQGLLLKSDDRGRNFAALPSPYKGSFFGLLQTGSGTLIAHGLRGNAFRSTDGGQQWAPSDTGIPTTIAASATAPNGAIVLLGQAGELQRSVDGGLSFSRTPARQPLPAAGLAATADGQWVIATLRGMQRVAQP